MKHTYPSHHRPGTHWSTDEAWKIMDSLKPGAIPDDVRNYLAGQIAGTLIRAHIQAAATDENVERLRARATELGLL